MTTGEDSGERIRAREILAIGGAVGVGTGAFVAYMTLVYDPPRRNFDTNRAAIERLKPNIKATILSESKGSETEDPSLLLRQRLSDGRVVTARKPVFIGEVAVHEPGERVVPSDLDPPLPPQP